MHPFQMSCHRGAAATVTQHPTHQTPAYHLVVDRMEHDMFDLQFNQTRLALTTHFNNTSNSAIARHGPLVATSGKTILRYRPVTADGSSNSCRSRGDF